MKPYRVLIEDSAIFEEVIKEIKSHFEVTKSFDDVKFIYVLAKEEEIEKLKEIEGVSSVNRVYGCSTMARRSNSEKVD